MLFLANVLEQTENVSSAFSQPLQQNRTAKSKSLKTFVRLKVVGEAQLLFLLSQTNTDKFTPFCDSVLKVL
ncbi:hypothetical protein L8106_23805 [Lyngbya sp. PCC 8106]|nr:hypothetical protein L8106_23805 [Lyngbya sp. PCC 8106]